MIVGCRSAVVAARRIRSAARSSVIYFVSNVYGRKRADYRFAVFINGEYGFFVVSYGLFGIFFAGIVVGELTVIVVVFDDGGFSCIRGYFRGIVGIAVVCFEFCFEVFGVNGGFGNSVEQYYAA